MAAIDDLRDRLDAVTGSGVDFMARCPAHPDGRPSLHVSQGRDGVVLTCFAGCSAEDICAQLGIKVALLFDAPRPLTGKVTPTISAVYDYTDEASDLLYQVVRYSPKDFKQRRSDGKGGWSYALGKVRRVLYRLPEVLAAVRDGVPVWVTEGEKDAEALVARGEVATTAPGGAGKWRPEYSAALVGAHVIVMADNDAAGRKGALYVAEQLRGVAADVEVMVPAPGFKDIAEQLGALDSLAGLTALADDVDPYAVPEVATLYRPIDWAEFWADEPIVTEWLVEPLLPYGRQVAVFSVAKMGKSLLSLEVAAALANGRPCLGSPAQPPIDVIYIDMEMTRDDLRERLLDLGYDKTSALDHLHYYQLSELPPLDTERGGADLAALVVWHQAQLVVLDTMARAVAGDENEADTYRAFYRFTGRKLKALRTALLRLDHAGKDGARGQRGSSAKDDDVDVVFRLSVDGVVVTLKRTRSRVAWVPETIVMTRTDDGELRHIIAADDLYPEGTNEAAGLLDDYGVALDATTRVAQTTLRQHGNGRRRAVVVAALKYRRKADEI